MDENNKLQEYSINIYSKMEEVFSNWKKEIESTKTVKLWNCEIYMEYLEKSAKEIEKLQEETKEAGKTVIALQKDLIAQSEEIANIIDKN